VCGRVLPKSEPQNRECAPEEGVCPVKKESECSRRGCVPRKKRESAAEEGGVPREKGGAGESPDKKIEMIFQ